MKLYRVMKVAADGKPLVGTRRNMLGVRPTDPTSTDPKRRADVAAVADDETVSPGEGLSTSLNPGQLRAAVGEALFELDTNQLSSQLVPNPDRPPHCLIQPAATTTLGELQQTLADTRDLWQRV